MALKGLGMTDWVPELLHALDLNAGYLFYKHVLLKHCDSFTREWVTIFQAGLGAPLDARRKATGRLKAERWHKACVWIELVTGSHKFPGGLRVWLPCLVMLIAKCQLDAKAGGGSHSSVLPRPPTAAAARAQESAGLRSDSDSEDEAPRPPPKRPPPKPTPTNPADLTMEQRLTLMVGKVLAVSCLRMLDAYEAYYTFHYTTHTPPPAMLTAADKEAYALRVGVTAVTAFQHLEDSNPEHKSWMPHIIWAVLPKFIADRGDCWRYSTAKLEARGAAAKTLGRRVVCWRRRSGPSMRTIAKRPINPKARKRKGRENRPPAQPFSQSYSSTGEQQLLEMVGLREIELRRGNTRKARKLGQLGRVTAARTTPKFHTSPLAEGSPPPFTCRDVFDAMLRDVLPAPYDMHGRKNPIAFAQLEMWAVACKDLGHVPPCPPAPPTQVPSPKEGPCL